MKPMSVKLSIDWTSGAMNVKQTHSRTETQAISIPHCRYMWTRTRRRGELSRKALQMGLEAERDVNWAKRQDAVPTRAVKIRRCKRALMDAWILLWKKAPSCFTLRARSSLACSTVRQYAPHHRAVPVKHFGMFLHPLFSGFQL